MTTGTKRIIAGTNGRFNSNTFSSRFAVLANRSVPSPATSSEAPERVPHVGQLVHVTYSRPLTADWGMAARLPAGNPMPSVSQRPIVTWEEIEQEAEAKYANRQQYVQSVGEPMDNPPLVDLTGVAEQAPQAKTLARAEGHLSASRETPLVESETGTADPSTGGIVQDEVDLPAGREPTAQPDDVSPPGGIVATTAPSSFTVAALVDATPPKLAATTAPECPLCAARRKAKRERTRRLRARVRDAAQLRTEATDVQ